MTRVAFIAGNFKPRLCGVARYTKHLTAHLEQRGVESVVVTTRAAARTHPKDDILGVVEDWRARDLLRVVHAVHDAEPDVVHLQLARPTHGFRRGIYMLPVALRAGRAHMPLVTTLHGSTCDWHERFLLRFSDAIVIGNANTERAVVEGDPALLGRIHRIPIGVNVDGHLLPRQEARARLIRDQRWAQPSEIIVFFGFLHPDKGIETLIEAFARVVTARPQARLLVMGGTESLGIDKELARRYKRELERLIDRLDVRGLVRFTDYVPNGVASTYLSAADVGVLPYAQGVTLKNGSLLNMLSHALPVVATRHDPPDPDLERSASVRFVAPRDAEGLAAALSELLDDVHARAELGRAARRFSRAFSWESIAERHIALYGALTTSG